MLAWLTQHALLDTGTLATLAGFVIRHFAPKVYAALTSAQGKAVVADIPGLAADVEKALKDAGHPLNPGAQATIAGVLNALPKVVAVALLALMLCLGPKLCPAAELGLSQSAVLGSGLYRPQSDGSLVSSGGAAVGYQLNASLGSLSGTAWTNYVSLSLGAALETAPLTYGGSDIEEFGDLAWGLGTGVGNIIPGVSNTSVLLGGFTRVLGARAYDTTSYGFSANWSFGTPFWTDK